MYDFFSTPMVKNSPAIALIAQIIMPAECERSAPMTVLLWSVRVSRPL
jgi:hypothetical protein